jgi:hypothetical protein
VGGSPGRAAQKKAERLRGLAERVVEYASGKGGAIEFLPAVIAKDLSPRRTLDPAGVERAMRWMTKKGMAKIIQAGKYHAPRFLLLN